MKRKEESKMKKKKEETTKGQLREKGLMLEGTAHGCWIRDVAVVCSHVRVCITCVYV